MKKITAETMTKKVFTVSAAASLEAADALMEEKNIRHLPVVDEAGLVIGIVSNRDIQRAINPNKPGFASNLKVADVMSWPALTVSEDTPIKDVAEGMIDEKVSAFLVTRGENEVAGIVTSEDLLRLLYTILKGEKVSTFKTLPYTPVVREALQELQSLGI